MAKKKIDVTTETVEEVKKKDEYGLDSNRAKEKSEISPEELDANSSIKLQIIDQIEKINNRYYLLIIKNYIDKLGG